WAATAAMRPAMPDSVSVVEGDQASHGAHAHPKIAADGDRSEHAAESEGDSADNCCCQAYCGVFAIDSPMPKLAHPVAVSIKGFMNDLRAFGECPALHRPPNI